MKVFVCDFDIFDKYKEKDDYNWCENNEILFYGMFRYNHHKGLKGITTSKGCTIFTVKDINIDISLLREILNSTYKELGHNVNDGVVELGDDFFNLQMDLYKNLDETIKDCQTYEVGDVLRVNGYIFSKIS